MRSPVFTASDELAILRGLVFLPSSSLDAGDVELLLDLVRSLRLQRLDGVVGVRLCQNDLRAINWLADEIRRVSRSTLQADVGAIVIPLFSLRLRVRDGMLQQLTPPADRDFFLGTSLNSAAFR